MFNMKLYVMSEPSETKCVCAHVYMDECTLAGRGVCVSVFMHTGVYAVDHWIQCLLALCNLNPTDLYILFHNRTSAVALNKHTPYNGS